MIVGFDNIGLTYDGEAETLTDLNFSLEEGEFRFLTGPSGAGKTSLLKLIYLAHQPTSGRMTLFGQDVTNAPREELPALRRRIGVVFQEFRLLDHLTAFENAALPMKVAGVNQNQYREDVRELLNWVGLGSRMDAKPATLSGGEKQRVALARALVAKPDLILADEPTGNVDPGMGEKIMKLFVELNKLGAAVIVATHDIQLIETLGKKTVKLENGRLMDDPLHGGRVGVAPHLTSPCPAKPIENPRPEVREPRLKKAPLLPEAGAGGAPLTAVIGVISFLATLALAAFIMIAVAASNWTTELNTSLTVQIKGEDADAIAADTAAALDVLSTTEGVIETSVVEPEEAAKLLEPWLGKSNLSSYLSVPAIIEVKASEELLNNVALLQNRLAAAAPGAVLDDHSEWNDRLAAAARSGQALAFAVFALVMGAACANSTFAARAGLAANNDVVSLLHLVGANDDFIAKQVQRRFLILGLRGSIAGLIAGLLALGIAALATRRGASGYFLPEFHIEPGIVIPLIGVPLAICLVTAMTARLTVLRTLRDEY